MSLRPTPYSLRSDKGFTLIELLVVISIIALLIGILLPALGAARRTARQMQNSTQVRGIHQSCVTFAQSNKGWFPGLDSDGENLAPADNPYSDAQGIIPCARYALLIGENYITPEYVIAPSEVRDMSPWDMVADPLLSIPETEDHISYTMLSLRAGFGGTEYTRDGEWRDSVNSQAIMLGDRNTGADAAVDSSISSIWTEIDSGDWSGSLVANDNSVNFYQSPVIESTRYANGSSFTDDSMFILDDTTDHADGALTYAGYGSVASHFYEQGDP